MLQTHTILGQELGAIDPQLAWSAWEPTPEEPWDAKRVRHLMRRGGFGAKDSEVKQLLDAGPSKAIDVLMGKQNLQAT
jgi:hypothetical protein